MAELDRLGLLPTPSASNGSGGKQQSFDSLRSGRHQTHLTNLPRLLDLEAEQPPLLRTPQAQVTEPKPGIKLEGRRPSDPQVGLADQVLADFHGDDGEQPVPLFPTPDTGVSPNGHGRRGGRPGNGRQSGASLDAVVRDLGGTHDGDEPLLLPTPMARHSGNTPENHLAKKPGRSVVTDLAILVENGLLETGGELPPPAVAPDVPLLPTPQTINRSSRRAMLGISDPEGNRRHWTGPGLEQVVEMLGGSLPKEFLSPDEIPGSYREDLGEPMPLLPTPQTRDSTGGKPEAVHRGRGYGADLNDIAAAGLLDQGEMKLLPTPTTINDREKRTTHAGGNPTLQGALCGINPVDARRLGLKDDDHPLLPTPRANASDGMKSTVANRRAKKQSVSLSEAIGDMTRDSVRGDDEHPILPTPMARDHRTGSSAEMERNSPNLSSIDALLPPAEEKRFPLLPTPKAHDGVFGTPRTSGRPIEKSTHLQTIVSLMGLPGDNPVPETPLLPTPMARDHRSGGPADVARHSPPLSSIGALLPTPAAWDTGGGRQHTTRPTRNGKVLSEVLRDLLTTPDYNTAADQEDGDGDGVELMPTPQARDWKGTPSSVHRNGGLNRAIDQLVAEAPPPEPEPETVPEPSGDQYTLFPIGGEPEPEPGPLLPTPVAQDGNGHMQDPSADVGNNGRSVSLADVVSRLPEGAGPLLPTPTVGARWVRNSPGEMARVNPALGAVIADLAENGEASRFYGGEDDPLLPTPVAGDPYSNANPESRKRRGYGPDLPDVASNYFGMLSAGDVPLLPTPKTAEKRTSRRAVMESHSRSGPSMGQALEIAQGILPHEFDSWEELPPGWQPDAPLLPTPVTTDAAGTRNSTAWRSDPESKAKIGDTLTDAMWKLAADRGEMELPDGPMRGTENGDPLLPTPTSRDHKGKTHPKGGKVPGSTTRGNYLPDAIALLPTPNAEQSRGTRSPEGVARRMARGDKQTSLEDAITLLPTPSAQDGNRGGSNPQKMRDANHMVKLIDAVLGGDLKPEEELLPTPGAADAKRGSADLARADRPGAGGDDLITATTKTSRAGQWGKYAPAVARWEALTRPAPAPTEPNKNGNPRLTARFSEWLLGWPEGWVTDPEIGISRSGQLRLIGNGVVPQQAAAALVILLKMLDSEEPDAESETRHVS